MSKGLDLKRGREIDALDEPVLSIKLLMIVLARRMDDLRAGRPGILASGQRDIRLRRQTERGLHVQDYR